MNKKWLAAYVKMHHEKKVRDQLTSLNIDNFLPIQTEIRQWSDRKKKVEKILIPMMIFVNVTSEEQHKVIKLPSVLRYLVLRGDHVPSEIPDTQMQNFKFMIDNSDYNVDFNSNNFEPGERIRVIKGSLAGLEGEMIYIDGKSNIIIRIDKLGCAVVELNASYVEKI